MEGYVVILRKMLAEEYSQYLPRLMEGYAQDLSRNLDLPIDAARERSKKQTSDLLNQGVDTPGHLIYTVCLENSLESVGVLWVFVDDAKKEAFIYDIEIKEAFRGKGLGRAALLAIEDPLRVRGIEKLGLHVFGDNPIAIHLYESLGYKVFSMNMRKRLTAEQ